MWNWLLDNNFIVIVVCGGVVKCVEVLVNVGVLLSDVMFGFGNFWGVIYWVCDIGLKLVNNDGLFI